MRKKIVAGNWKMNMDINQSLNLTREIMNEDLANDVEVILFPPFTSLNLVAERCRGSRFSAGAQNCANHNSGAYTGEVAPGMIKSAGAKFVIVGHSERRAYYHETNLILKEKTDLALENGLGVVFCCGEKLAERENKRHFEVVDNQIKESLFHLSNEQLKNVIVAYEPVWAIGTGVNASAEQAQEMHAFIRGLFSDQYGKEISENLSILYGGSCKPSNAAELFSNPDVDGGLIGGASLVAKDFAGIINSF